MLKNNPRKFSFQKLRRMSEFFLKEPFAGLGRNVAILGLVSFFTDASSDMIYPLFPLFVTLTLGASTEMLGLIEGVAESTASIVKLFSGWLSDKLQNASLLPWVVMSLRRFHGRSWLWR